MSRTITIGGLDLASFVLREGVALPLLEDELPVLAWFTDCLQQVVAERRGVILLSPHGAGKSVAIQRGAHQFECAEEARRRDKDAAYEPRRVVGLTTLRVQTARELYVAMYRAAFDTLPAERVYRRTKTCDELRDELIARCAEENVVAFVVDEAQTLTDAAIEALRDFMAVSEAACRDKIEASPRGERVRPAGVGVLLVGTMAFQARLGTLSEFGRRWIRAELVAVPEEAAVPDLLRRLLPAFETGAKALGEDEWTRLVANTLTAGRALPISTLHDFTRTYVRRAAADQPKARKLGDLTWDLELFRQAAYELVGLQLRGQEAA